jgi:hypothetical protein
MLALPSNYLFSKADLEVLQSLFQNANKSRTSYPSLVVYGISLTESGRFFQSCITSLEVDLLTEATFDSSMQSKDIISPFLDLKDRDIIILRNVDMLAARALDDLLACCLKSDSTQFINEFQLESSFKFSNFSIILTTNNFNLFKRLKTMQNTISILFNTTESPSEIRGAIHFSSDLMNAPRSVEESEKEVDSTIAPRKAFRLRSPDADLEPPADAKPSRSFFSSIFGKKRLSDFNKDNDVGSKILSLYATGIEFITPEKGQETYEEALKLNHNSNYKISRFFEINLPFATAMKSCSVDYSADVGVRDQNAFSKANDKFEQSYQTYQIANQEFHSRIKRNIRDKGTNIIGEYLFETVTGGKPKAPTAPNKNDYIQFMERRGNLNAFVGFEWVPLLKHISDERIRSALLGNAIYIRNAYKRALESVCPTAIEKRYKATMVTTEGESLILLAGHKLILEAISELYDFSSLLDEGIALRANELIKKQFSNRSKGVSYDITRSATEIRLYSVPIVILECDPLDNSGASEFAILDANDPSIRIC